MIIHVKVKPNSSTQKIEEIEKGKYIAHLKSVPENNKANIELIKIISKKFEVPRENIRIKFGKTSSKKIIEVKS